MASTATFPPMEKMLQVHCSGSPREIGIQHGLAAVSQIQHGLAFYRAYFKEKAKLEWPDAVAAARKFLPLLERDWPDFVEEMKGIADGTGPSSGITFDDILALNCRSEISMGLMNDGCTALSLHTPSSLTTQQPTILAQNWDWDTRQSHSLIALTISPSPSSNLPTITQITEGGIIGKIGFNSSSVGVTLNAIRAKGVDFAKLPLHLALRACLNSSSRDAAIATLEKYGVASAGHILVADATHGGKGLEWSWRDCAVLEGESVAQEGDGKSAGDVMTMVVHTNHFMLTHAAGIKEAVISDDTKRRVERIRELIRSAAAAAGPEQQKGKGTVTVEDVEGMLEDEQGLPGAINRKSGGKSESATLFGIVMDLQKKEARVRVGRPTEGGERLVLRV